MKKKTWIKLFCIYGCDIDDSVSFYVVFGSFGWLRLYDDAKISSPSKYFY